MDGNYKRGCHLFYSFTGVLLVTTPTAAKTWFDRFCRRVATSHSEEMLNFGGGGYNMFGGYGRAAKVFDQVAFAEKIIEINQGTEGQGVLLNGHPSSVINSAMYYSSRAEQGSAIFRSIIENHMFVDGNKRTAVNAFQFFANHVGLKTVSQQQMMNVATGVAKGNIGDVVEIANLLTR